MTAARSGSRRRAARAWGKSPRLETSTRDRNRPTFNDHTFKSCNTIQVKTLPWPTDKPRKQAQYEETASARRWSTSNGYTNPHQIPRVEKITLNMGVGAAIGDKKILDTAIDAMTQITGQKPVITNARKSVANFRLREGMPIGCMVTLRRKRMYEFLDRLVSIVLPRVRDFRGINRKAFDGRGNLHARVDRAVGVSPN